MQPGVVCRFGDGGRDCDSRHLIRRLHTFDSPTLNEIELMPSTNTVNVYMSAVMSIPVAGFYKFRANLGAMNFVIDGKYILSSKLGKRSGGCFLEQGVHNVSLNVSLSVTNRVTVKWMSPNQQDWSAMPESLFSSSCSREIPVLAVDETNSGKRRVK